MSSSLPPQQQPANAGEVGWSQHSGVMSHCSFDGNVYQQPFPQNSVGPHVASGQYKGPGAAMGHFPASGSPAATANHVNTFGHQEAESLNRDVNGPIEPRPTQWYPEASTSKEPVPGWTDPAYPMPMPMSKPMSGGEQYNPANAIPDPAASMMPTMVTQTGAANAPSALKPSYNVGVTASNDHFGTFQGSRAEVAERRLSALLTVLGTDDRDVVELATSIRAAAMVRAAGVPAAMLNGNVNEFWYSGLCWSCQRVRNAQLLPMQTSSQTSDMSFPGYQDQNQMPPPCWSSSENAQ